MNVQTINCVQNKGITNNVGDISSCVFIYGGTLTRASNNVKIPTESEKMCRVYTNCNKRREMTDSSY